MTARDKDPAVLGPAIRSLPFPEPALDQQGFDRASSPNIGTSVKRIAEDVTDEALRRNLPDESRSTDRIGGQLHIVITKPLECLADAQQFPEFRECEFEWRQLADQNAEQPCRLHPLYSPPEAA
jgi:hypothetical protein